MPCCLTLGDTLIFPDFTHLYNEALFKNDILKIPPQVLKWLKHSIFLRNLDLAYTGSYTVPNHCMLPLFTSSLLIIFATKLLEALPRLAELNCN